MENRFPHFARHETALREAQRLRAEALRYGTGWVIGAVRRAFVPKK